MLKRTKNRFGKYQAGGALSPLASYIPTSAVVPQQSSKTSVKSSESEKEYDYGMSKSDILKSLQNLLPSDSMVIANDVSKLMKLIDSNEKFDGMFENEINNAMISLNLKINAGQQAKKEYELNRDSITKNKAQDEFAIDQYGRVLYFEDGKIKTTDIDNIDGKQLLTYGDISNLRKNSPHFSFNENILSVMRQSASMDDITKNIFEVVNKIGSVDNSSSYFAKKQGEYITEGLKQIIQEGYDGVYQIKDSSNTSTKEQKMYAVETVLNMMSKNCRNALELKAKLSKTTPYEMIYKIIAMSDKPKFARDIVFKADSDSKKGKDGNGGSAENKTVINAARAIHEGYGDLTDFIITNGDDNNYGQSVKAVAIKLNPKLDKQGLSTLSSIRETGANGAIDFSNASIGGNHVDETTLREFVTGDMLYTIYMPYKYEETDKGSHIVVDFDNMGRMKEINDYINKNFGSVNSSNYQEVNKRMAQMGYNISFDQNGNPQNGNLKKFVAFNVKAGYKTMNRLDLLDDRYTRVIENNDMAKAIAESTGVKSDDGHIGINPVSWWTEDKVVESVVYMPTTTSIMNASLGDQSPFLKEDTGLNAGQLDLARQQHQQKPVFQKPTFQIEQ